MAGGHAENQGFVTEKTFNNKLGKIEKALQTQLNRQKKSTLRDKEDTEMCSLPKTVLGVHSRPTPSVVDVPRVNRGCSYKEFTCKPPIFNGERDPVQALQ